jgi:hypothetical protein
MSDNIISSDAESQPVVPETQTEQVTSAASPAVTNVTSLMDIVSEDYKPLIESKGFKDVNDVVKSYSNLEKMVGNSVRIPSEDASLEAKAEFYNKIKDLDGVIVKPQTDEEKAAFYNKLGRPESSDAYNLQDIVDGELYGVVPNLDQELNDFKSIAHEIGLTDEQAQKLVAMRMGTLKQQQEMYGQTMEDSQRELQKLWGQDYDNRLNAAKQVAKLYSEKYPDAMQELINGPSGNNPAFLNMLSELGSSFKEKGHEGMQSANFGMTPHDAQMKIAEKRADQGFMKAYQDELHPGHKKAIADMTRLYEIASGQ